MRSLIFVAYLLVLLALSPAVASHCDTYTTSWPEIDECAAGLPDPCYYVDNDLCQPDPCGTIPIWIYEESNGIVGLQRDDETVDDTCHGMIVGDTIIF